LFRFAAAGEVGSWIAQYIVIEMELLEVTITHNLTDAAEVAELFRQRLIALDWGRKGPNPDEYEGRGYTDVTLFNTMRQHGAAVIAAYKKATSNPSDRLVGYVEAGAEFEYVNGLLCLPLSNAQVVDSSASFLGNLAPRQCTVQHCGNRAKGRLAALVQGNTLPRDVWSLHHLDVEWLVTNYLVATRLCVCVWSGGRAFEDIDHVGLTKDGHELLAQTTVSDKLVGTKAARLLSLARSNRVLYFFGPASSEAECLAGIAYHSIETVFSELDRTSGGQWLINRMLGIPHASDSA
jgi:hypothetical protein